MIHANPAVLLMALHAPVLASGVPQFALWYHVCPTLDFSLRRSFSTTHTNSSVAHGLLVFDDLSLQALSSSLFLLRSYLRRLLLLWNLRNFLWGWWWCFFDFVVVTVDVRSAVLLLGVFCRFGIVFWYLRGFCCYASAFSVLNRYAVVSSVFFLYWFNIFNYNNDISNSNKTVFEVVMRNIN